MISALPSPIQPLRVHVSEMTPTLDGPRVEERLRNDTACPNGVCLREQVAEARDALPGASWEGDRAAWHQSSLVNLKSHEEDQGALKKPWLPPLAFLPALVLLTFFLALT